MKEIRYTLLTDGSFDKALIPILSWLLYQHCPDYAIQPEWADLWKLPRPPKKMPERIIRSVELYPCDLLFVHRDAEGLSREERASEIRQALAEIALLPAVCVVPVRMTEAWLLFDETAIRKAAGNPNGNLPLGLPVIHNIESLPDPKQILHDLLRSASGHTSKRRLKRMSATGLLFVSQNSLPTTRFCGSWRHLEILKRNFWRLLPARTGIPDFSVLK